MTVPTTPITDPWKRYIMALDRIQQRMERICGALEQAGVPYAIVGGQAVALWVATIDPAATRTTKDVDLLIDRQDLPRARAAAHSVDMDYYEVLNVGMFIEKSDPNPRHAVHLVWADKKVKAEDELPSPGLADRQYLEANTPVVPLVSLVQMKLMANRDHDRVHLRDMIDIGLIGSEMLAVLPKILADRLAPLLNEQGR
jgi:hypothetical protein